MRRNQKALKHSRQAWAAGLWFCLAFILSFLSQPAQAKDPGKDTLQEMVYEVYAGGIHAVQAKLDIDVRPDKRYDVMMEANTRGLLGKLAPWSGTFESHGWKVGGGDYRPELHKSTAIWRGDEDVKEYKYTKDRKFLGLWVTGDGKPRHKKDVEDELTQGTTDVLASSLAVFDAVGRGQSCEGTSEVFDGKRRFELKFNPQGLEELQSTKYNIYQGPAMKCTVEVVPVAGAWSEKPRGWLSIQEQGRAKGTMPTVWLAQVEEGGAAVPVKVMVKTDYGTLFMHLVEYKSGETMMVAQERASESK